MMSGLMGTMAQGMAFGAGSAVAHQAVGAAVNSFSGSGEQPQQQQMPQDHMSQQQYIQQPQQDACAMDQQAFQQCFQQSGGQISACQQFCDALQACQLNSQSQRAF